MNGYRDDRAALEERLAQLESAHHERLVASLPEKRRVLEDQRFAVLHPAKSARKFLSGMVRFVAVGVMLLFLRDEKGAPAGIALTIAAISLLFLVGWYAVDARQTSQRHKRLAAIDEALAALDAKKVRVELPTELGAIHVRIAELEGSGEELAEATPPPRTPRSADTSR